MARAASVRKRARSSVASSRSSCSRSATWCRSWKAWVGAARRGRRGSGAGRRGRSGGGARRARAATVMPWRASSRAARAARRSPGRGERPKRLGGAVDRRRGSCRSSGRSRAPPPTAAGASAPSSRPSASLSWARRSWVSRWARCRVRKARARFGAFEATSWRSPSGGAVPKTGSARASRMSATMRSVEPAASSVTSMPKAAASASTTRAGTGRWLFSIWLR